MESQNAVYVVGVGGDCGVVIGAVFAGLAWLGIGALDNNWFCPLVFSVCGHTFCYGCDFASLIKVSK